ncbi:MAG: exodeoxyribonuclease VII large subunit [Planctomycetia bacterium]|nr:exodeoxyribonuclease VII large subunit [Planctomycetia bacterium]
MSLFFFDEEENREEIVEDGQPPIFSVTQLTHGVRDLLGTVFPDVRVSGEVTDLTAARTGHRYFSLKDENSQLSAVMWRSVAERIKTKIESGLKVICRGRIEVYPPRGTYQLIVSQVEVQGQGELERAFLELKQRLEAEGLFDRSHKKPIPAWIRRVGVITSPDGAAIHDFLEVLRRRWQGVDVMIYPAPVQGKGAAERLAEGVRVFNRLGPDYAPECLVITRGGGSMEDLWEFNEEVLIRAVFESDIPVISAVGHEIDVTLCDLVADLRALTPTEAAERISPDIMSLKERWNQYVQRLRYAILNVLEMRQTQLQVIRTRPIFKFPYRLLDESAQKVDVLQKMLDEILLRRLENLEKDVLSVAGRLDTLSPVKVLSRGYSVTKDERTGKVLLDAAEVLPGTRIITRLHNGELVSRVEEMMF